MHWQNLIHVVAFTNGIFLAFSLVFASKINNQTAQFSLALFMASLAALLAIFTFVDAGWLTASKSVQGAHDFVALLIPGFFLHYVDSVSDSKRHPAVLYLPGTSYLLALMLIPQWTLNNVRLEHIIAIQICASGFGSYLLYCHFRDIRQWPRHLAMLVSYLWLLHLTQLLRIILPGIDWIFETVPLVGSIFFIALTLLVLNDKQIFHKLLSISKNSLIENAGLFKQLQDVMVSQKPWLDSSLTARALAEMVAMPERNLSNLLNSEKTSFFQFVNGYRIDEAKRLLASKEECRTSVEAIALMVGFRSRSAFYQAFNKELGCTPAAYRKQMTP